MSETYYDEHIAPKLMAIAKECEDNGLSLVTCCDYELEGISRIVTLQTGSSFAIRLVDVAAEATLYQKNVARPLLKFPNVKSDYSLAGIIYLLNGKYEPISH